MMKKFTDITQVPEDQREMFLKVEALTLKLVDLVNNCGEKPEIVLTALLNTYINGGISFGRLGECARAMLSTGGQIVLAEATKSMASGFAQPGTDQAPPVTRH